MRTKKEPGVAPGPVKSVLIKPLNFEEVVVRIVGDAPYVHSKFSSRTIESMRTAQATGGAEANKRKKNNSKKNFDLLYEEATHFADDGWCGIPASAFRAGVISACRLVNFKMTLAKLSLFITPDGFDRTDGSPLVRIYGKREKHEAVTRLPNGSTDIRARPMWRTWYADVRISWDADQFKAEDVLNLMNRVGAQVGIGEGRPDSKNSYGCGWGTFRVLELNPKPGSVPLGFKDRNAA